MNYERLQQIKHRITRNESAPDVPALARELINALEKHLAPAPVEAAVPAVAVTQTVNMERGQLDKLLKESADELEAESHKKRGKK